MLIVSYFFRGLKLLYSIILIRLSFKYLEFIADLKYKSCNLSFTMRFTHDEWTCKLSKEKVYGNN